MTWTCYVGQDAVDTYHQPDFWAAGGPAGAERRLRAGDRDPPVDRRVSRFSGRGAGPESRGRAPPARLSAAHRSSSRPAGGWCWCMIVAWTSRRCGSSSPRTRPSSGRAGPPHRRRRGCRRGQGRRRPVVRGRGRRAPPHVSVVDVRMPPTQRDEGCGRRSRLAAGAGHAGPRPQQYVERQYATSSLADRAAASATSSRTASPTSASSWTPCAVSPRGNRLDPEVVASSWSRALRRPAQPLTPREREVLAAMAEGADNMGIAALLASPRVHGEAHQQHLRQAGAAHSENDHRRVLAVLTYLGS